MKILNYQTISQEEAYNFHLDITSKLVLHGENVSDILAKDIIIRTDILLTDFSKYAGGSDTKWNSRVHQTLGYNLVEDYTWKNWRKLKQGLNIVDLRVLANNWTGGGDGWIDLNGSIYYDTVSSRHLSVYAINDFETLVDNWPSLKLKLYLINYDKSSLILSSNGTIEYGIGTVTYDKLNKSMTPPSRTTLWDWIGERSTETIPIIKQLKEENGIHT